MIFRQLYEPESSTYTYLFADPQTRAAVLLDPVVETVERDLAVLQKLELTLACTLDTHIHSDHCGHFQHRGAWYHSHGHRHGPGCGHHFRGGFWVVVD